MSPTPRPQIRLNSWLWPGAVATLFLLEIFFPYQGWLILLIGIGLAWLIGWLWAREMAAALRLVREMRFGWAQVGDLLEERFVLKNQGWIPAVWVEVRDHSTLPGYQVGCGTGVESYSTNSWITRRVCSRRGQYVLGPTELITGDPFGIYTVTISDPACVTILVTPPVLPLPQIQIAANGRADEGRLSRKMAVASPVVDGVRGYQPGDSLRRIHWPTLARRGSLFIKTATDLPSGNWWIILDLDRTVQIGEGMASTEEIAVLLAASLAGRGLQAGFPVGLVANSREITWLPPRLGSGQRQEILRALAEASPGDHSLAVLLENLFPLNDLRSSLIVITASPDRDWLAPLSRRIEGGAAPTVLWLDPAAFGGKTGIPILQDLANLGIAAYPITPESLPSPDLLTDVQNRWEWRKTPTGRVIAIHQPPDMSWKALR